LPVCFPGAKAVGLDKIFTDITEEEEKANICKIAVNLDVTKKVPDHGYYGPNHNLFIYKIKHGFWKMIFFIF